MWMAWGPGAHLLLQRGLPPRHPRRQVPVGAGQARPRRSGRRSGTTSSGRIEHGDGDRGVATWDESLMLFLERSGYTEESFHTFSYSPIFDDYGVVAGMLCVVKEDTEEVIAHRRMQTLRDLGSRRASNLTEAETISSACDELAQSPAGPAVLAGLPLRRRRSDRPAGRLHRLRRGPPGRPGDDRGRRRRTRSGRPRPPRRASRRSSGDLDEPVRRACRPAPGSASPREALVVPLAASAGGRPYGFQVFGLNRVPAPRRGLPGLLRPGRRRSSRPA